MLVSSFLLGAGASFAQKTKVIKANKEYDQYAFIDAQQVYLDVLEQGVQSAQIYENLGDTYYFNSQYKEATQWYKLLVDNFPEETAPEYLFRLANCYKSSGNYQQAEDLMRSYFARTGDSTSIARYYSGENYLERIAANARNSELKSVSVNSAASDFGPTFYGDKIVFSTASDTIVNGKLELHEWNNQPYSDLYMADVDDMGDLSNLERLEGPVNSIYHESTPVFTKDGQTMYFTRNNYLEEGKKKGKRAMSKDREGTLRLKVYKATLGDDGWGDIQQVKFADKVLNNEKFSMAHPTLSLDEKRLYFAADLPGTEGMSDIWYAVINEDGTLADPENLRGINTEARESFPFISKENTLYFSSDGHPGLGGFDVFASSLDNSGLATEEVSNLGEPTNSTSDDFSFIYDSDSKKGYVSSNRSGDGGFVSDDIYLVVPCLVQLTGEVTDLETGKLLPGAEVQLFGPDDKPYGEPIVVGNDASYSFDIECKQNYRLRATRDDYDPNEIPITAPAVSGELYKPITLKKSCPYENTLNCILDLQTIYFDLDRFNIRPDAEIELAKILAALKRYPELKIHIESHTDSRATDEYNVILSERRAQSTKDWLIERGIDPSRLTAEGFGETQLLNECANDVECSEEKHQLNRRSIFKIVD